MHLVGHLPSSCQWQTLQAGSAHSQGVPLRGLASVTNLEPHLLGVGLLRMQPDLTYRECMLENRQAIMSKQYGLNTSDTQVQPAM